MVVFLCFEPFCTASVFAAVATRSWRTAAKPRKNPEVQRGRHAVAMDRDRTAKAHGRHARCASDPRWDRAWRGGRAVLAAWAGPGCFYVLFLYCWNLFGCVFEALWYTIIPAMILCC